ncbi:DUF2381 family protein [Archangium violaceum]|uniref:DUF2381 family protein n=1 Tax=Archangium violaceum TaxID=83451 RepID=UPI00194F31FD|nr:DUF2381 family protein [Archangium violaceum]QRN98095.1 DUF2381 family protein [Archangium violaceum]
MWKFLLRHPPLLLLLMASAAVARVREPNVRNVYVRDDPKDEAKRVYVTGQVVTVLRFQQPCDPERTKMLGWEGRFEPVHCAGKSVLVVPLQDLEPEDRFLLLVTLADGKELPFTLTAIGKTEWEQPDQQVNVFLDPETQEALRAQLKDARTRAQHLEEANRRHWKEDTEDHALARFLAKGSLKFTPLRARKRWYFKNKGATIEATVLTGKAKAAVLFHVTNSDPTRPWSLSEARLLTTRPGEKAPVLFGEAKPFALQKDWDELGPGASGSLALVVDKSAFTSREGPCDLTVELYRHDGLLETHVLLDRRLIRE